MKYIIKYLFLREQNSLSKICLDAKPSYTTFIMYAALPGFLKLLTHATI